MSDLPDYAPKSFFHASKTDLALWLVHNPLPTICEPKIDGVRVFLFKSGEKLVLSSKDGTVHTPKSSPDVFATMPELIHAPHRMILDGEYVSGKGLFLFDILHVDKRDMRPLPLRERKNFLQEAVSGTDLELPFELANSMKEILALKERFIWNGHEGLVAKNPTSTYGQPGSWLKMKRYDTIDCFILEHETSQETEGPGIPQSWYIGVYDEQGRTVPLGNVEAFVEEVDPWQLKKGSVVEIRFQDVTDDMKLSGGLILRVRHDKLPHECLLSQIK